MISSTKRDDQMRTLKEQEYQLLALKERSEKECLGFLLEIFVGIVATYVAMLWHNIPAAMVGAAFILSSWNCFHRWRWALTAHVQFKNDFDAMVTRGMEKRK